MFSARALVSVPFVLLGLTACGDDGDADAPPVDPKAEAQAYAKAPVKQILEDVQAATKDLTSVHVFGRVVDKGDTLRLNLSLDTDGDCSGSVRFKGKGAVRIVAVDGVSYFKADDRFWRSQGADGDAVARFIGGRWATESSDAEGFAELCDLDQLLDELTSVDGRTGTSKVVGTQTLSGLETVVVSAHSPDGVRAEVAVAAAAPHYLVRADLGKSGAVTFSQFDVPVDPAKPAASDVVDLSKLGS